jgi:hypothetical protein
VALRPAYQVGLSPLASVRPMYRLDAASWETIISMVSLDPRLLLVAPPSILCRLAVRPSRRHVPLPAHGPDVVPFA